MDTNVKEANKVRIETVIKGLEKRNITGHYCETAADAVKTIESLIAEGSQVSWGGSATLNEIGIKEVLKAGNYDVNDPMDPSVGRDESTMRRKKALTCDAFLASLNAITMDGEIVNIDGTGNRIAAIAFGPDKVILVAGVNKIAAGDIVVDRTYVFDVPVEVSAERVRISRGDSGDRLEQENSAFFDKVRHGFLQEAAADKSIVVVDGTQKESVVFDSIQKDLEQLL